MLQFACINTIIFNGIGVGEKFGLFKSRDGMNHLNLYIARQTTAQSIWIDNCT